MRERTEREEKEHMSRQHAERRAENLSGRPSCLPRPSLSPSLSLSLSTFPVCDNSNDIAISRVVVFVRASRVQHAISYSRYLIRGRHGRLRVGRSENYGTIGVRRARCPPSRRPASCVVLVVVVVVLLVGVGVFFFLVHVAPKRGERYRVIAFLSLALSRSRSRSLPLSLSLSLSLSRSVFPWISDTQRGRKL